MQFHLCDFTRSEIAEVELRRLRRYRISDFYAVTPVRLCTHRKVCESRSSTKHLLRSVRFRAMDCDELASNASHCNFASVITPLVKSQM